MVRTRPSPMCCCASQMMSIGVRDVEAFAGDADGGVDLGDLPFGELAVDGRSGDLDHFADYVCCCAVAIIFLSLTTRRRPRR